MRDTIARYGACFALGFCLATASCVLVIGRWKSLYRDADFRARSYRTERNQARADAAKCWERLSNGREVSP